MAGEQAGNKVYISYAGLLMNVLVLFTGILKNPGIPYQVIDKALKQRRGKGDQLDSSDDEVIEDIEK